MFYHLENLVVLNAMVGMATLVVFRWGISGLNEVVILDFRLKYRFCANQPRYPDLQHLIRTYFRLNSD